MATRGGDLIDYQEYHLGGGVSQIFFEFSPRKFGEMIQIDKYIFQMGWFNHQLEEYHKLFLGNVGEHLDGKNYQVN